MVKNSNWQRELDTEKIWLWVNNQVKFSKGKRKEKKKGDWGREAKYVLLCHGV